MTRRWLPARFLRPRRTLVLGGARSGKSSFAERLLAAREAHYVACGPAADDDPEWARRVAAHRARRPAHWTTFETTELPPLLARPGPPLLVDCLTTWLAAAMDECGLWTGAAGAERALDDRIERLLAAWSAAARTVVAVSNEVGSGVVPATWSGRRFRDAQGLLNARVVAASDRVWLLTAGLPRRLR